jgi:hypothetical protein
MRPTLSDFSLLCYPRELLQFIGVISRSSALFKQNLHSFTILESCLIASVSGFVCDLDQLFKGTFLENHQQYL